MTREDELFRKIEAGHTGCMDELIGLYYEEILRYCLWHAPNRFQAEDATQETFLKAIRYFDRYTHRGKFKSFLYQIAANTCVDMKRKRKPDVLEEEEGIPYQEKGFAQAEAEMDFQLLVRELPEELREIVLLRFSQDLKLREIGEVTGLPLRTVQSRLRKAVKQIKQKLQKQRGDINWERKT